MISTVLYCRTPSLPVNTKNRRFDQFRCWTDRQLNLARNWTLSPFPRSFKWDFRLKVPFNEWLNGPNVQFYRKDFERGKNEVLVRKHHDFSEVLNIFNGLALFKRRPLQGRVRFCQLSSAESLRSQFHWTNGDISLSILKSQELGLEGSDIAIRTWDRLGLLSWTWPILKQDMSYLVQREFSVPHRVGHLANLIPPE